MKKSNLLLIEDDEGFREQLKWALCEHYHILEADTLAKSLRVFKRERPAVVCLDMNLENRSRRGLDIIDALMSLNPKVKILVITGSGNREFGEKAIEKGASDYLTKPVDLDELKVLLSRAFRVSSLEQSKTLPDTSPAELDKPTILGESKEIKELLDHIERLSHAKVSVLIIGESGTGKELCALAIHEQSPRKDHPFVPINCGAIPESLIESELFGFVKGAFTGANTDKMGLIASAHQGTLFLDEIGEMPLNLQVKLLRFLEDEKVQRVGEVGLQKVDVRIIAATNKMHSLAGESGALRSDLYYRLSECEIYIPPLRERDRDVLRIAENLIQKNRIDFNLPKLTICQGAQDALMKYDWPGNIRELKNKINRATVNCKDQVIKEKDLDLPQETRNRRSRRQKNRTSGKNVVLAALKMTNYNISETAKKMGISRPTLYSLIRKHNISRSGEGNSRKAQN